MLGNVQALRAIAALMVVMVHAYAVESTYLPGRPWATPFHIVGTFGVDLFFVISGTVMVATSGAFFGQAAGWREFLARRITRIYPPYLIVTALVLVIYRYDPIVTGYHRSAPPDFLASFLALPQHGEPLLVVGWTLSYELVFYAVFALALRFERRRLGALAAAWLAAVVLIDAFGPPGNPWVRVLGSPLNLEFAWGMLIGAALLRRVLIAPRALFGLALVAIVATSVQTAYSGREFLEITWTRPFAVGLPMALLVYAALGLEQRRILAPRWLRAQGDASYALYLWHVPVIGAIGLALHQVHLYGIPARIAIIAGGYVCAIAVSFLAYAYLERPLLRRSRRYFESASSRTGRKAVAQIS